MSCDSLNQGSTTLIVTMGSLPEGFCPVNMQDLANAIADRLIVTPNQAFSTFAIGSVEPSSNVGPWLKDCLQWFVFDDNTARYIPITKGGFDNAQYFGSSNQFTVPSFIYKIKVSLWGGGGGGGGTNASDGAGGGGGAFVMNIMSVTPNQTITFTVGSGGSGTHNGKGGDGADSTFLGMTAGGGKGGDTNVRGGKGGQANGGIINMDGGAGSIEGNSTPASNGGGSPQGGMGGTTPFAGNVTDQDWANGTSPGGGGGGSGAANQLVGNGAMGGCLIEY